MPSPEGAMPIFCGDSALGKDNTEIFEGLLDIATVFHWSEWRFMEDR